MNANPQIEIEAAEALLDIGVSLPFFKIPFTRKVVRLTMRRPCLGGQIRLARLYLQTGVTYERMLEFTKHEELAYMALHGRRVEDGSPDDLPGSLLYVAVLRPSGMAATLVRR